MINDKGEELGIIYGWYNTKSGKWYVGQTVEPEKRFKRHINDAFNRKDNIHFHRALRKYGLDNFVYCVLEENVLRDNLDMREIDWIEYYDSFYSGYNLTLGGGGIKGKPSGMKGKHLSENARKRISEARKGKPTWNKGKSSWNKGIPMTEEAKKKSSESHKGKSVWNKGKHGIYSEETLKKMSESLKGRTGLCGSKNHLYGKPALNRRKVSKYDLNGNYIQTYNSIAEAIKNNTKCTGIIAACKGKSKQAGGFIWKYAS